MKLLKIDQKNNELVLIPGSLDDLWHLEKVIGEGDIVSGKTDRKIKPKNEGEKVMRQTIFVEIKAESINFHEHSGVLKVNGIIVGGRPEEFIELKSHQSLDIEPGAKIGIKKEALKKWQIERLRKAEKESASAGLLVVLMDDERAELAFVNQFSIKKKAKIMSGKQGKQFDEAKGKYFEELYEKISSLKAKKVLLAGPGFTRENFQKYIVDKKEKGFPKLISISTNDVGETGFRELLKSGKLDSLEKELQLSQESKLIEEFMEKVAKGLAEYGEENVKGALNLGAVDKLLVSETFLLKNRDKTEELMDLADGVRAETHIISSKNPNEEQISGFGGVVAILRYKLE